MNWTNIVNFLGGSALILAAIGWVCKSTVSHFLGRDLAQFKGEIEATNDRELASIKEKQEKELLALRGEQEKALAKIQASASERIESVKAALLRMERLESDLIKSRGEAYGEIWKLTGSINLFGPAIPASCAELSAQLRDWYFAHGWVLTQEAKKKYFLVQEVLNFLQMRSIPIRRPADEQLFSDSERPIEILSRLRTKEVQLEPRGEDADYSIAEMEACVSAWKSRQAATGSEETKPEQAWIVLQFVMSVFRSRLVLELGSRGNVHNLTTAPIGEI